MDVAHNQWCTASMLGRRFALLRDQTGAHGATLHRLRHTVATFLAARGQILRAQARLGDTSALARSSNPAVGDRLLPLVEAGLVARCSITDLEAGFSSTSPSAHLAMREARAAWPFVDMDQRVLRRATEVQDELAARSQHRGAKIADLLIAAAAEAEGLVVLHYDHDFDVIPKVTGQRTEWIVPAGSIS
jgi:predicted nucleic acid-binding protein